MNGTEVAYLRFISHVVQCVEHAMLDKRTIQDRGPVAQPDVPAHPESPSAGCDVASSPCGMAHVATAPWEYGPDFLATLDGSFSSAYRRDARARPCDVDELTRRIGQN